MNMRPDSTETDLAARGGVAIEDRPVDIAIDIRGATIPVGVPVEVRSRFDERWTTGFSVAAMASDSYQLRRLSDGSVLPAWFPATRVRPRVS
jgi:hypothetical protein